LKKHTMESFFLAYEALFYSNVIGWTTLSK
jgi:hypothetical protein